MRLALLYTYTILSYTVLYSFTFLNILLILALNSLGLQKAIRRVLSFWASASFLIIGKAFRIEGKENFNNERRYILLANHSSIFDIIGITAISPNISFFGRANLLEIPIFGKLLKVLNFIPMKSSDLKNVKNMIDKLIERTEFQTVAIFPEGTRTTNGELNCFRKGFIHVLKASKLDILPVSLVGLYEFKPKTRFYFNYSKNIYAKIHSPIPFSELENLDDKEIIYKVKTKIESALH